MILKNVEKNENNNAVFEVIPAIKHYQEHKYHDYYYVTDGGTHYHLKDCVYIQGRNAHRMTEDEFASGAYEPCKICIR